MGAIINDKFKETSGGNCGLQFAKGFKIDYRTE